MDVKVEGLQGWVGNEGILLRVFQPGPGAAVGRLKIGKATVKWYPGRTSKHYKQVSLNKLIEWIESQ